MEESGRGGGCSTLGTSWASSEQFRGQPAALHLVSTQPALHWGNDWKDGQLGRRHVPVIYTSDRRHVCAALLRQKISNPHQKKSSLPWGGGSCVVGMTMYSMCVHAFSVWIAAVCAPYSYVTGLLFFLKAHNPSYVNGIFLNSG